MNLIVIGLSITRHPLLRLLITTVFQAEPEGTLRLKVNLTGCWPEWQYHESHVARSVDKTSFPLHLFKLNTYCHRQPSQKLPQFRTGQDGEYPLFILLCFISSLWFYHIGRSKQEADPACIHFLQGLPADLPFLYALPFHILYYLIIHPLSASVQPMHNFN